MRTSTNPQFDRLVFDLGPIPVDASATAGAQYEIEFQASPPSLNFNTEDRLSALGVSIRRDGSRTRVTVDRRGRAVRAFRLGGSGNSSGRVVLDIGKSGVVSLAIPADADRVPERSVQVPVLGGDPPTTAQREVPVLGGGSPNIPVLGGDPPAQVSAAPARRSAPPSGSTGGEEVWVSVRAIDFEGVAGEAPSRDDLLNLELNVSVADNGDLVAPRTDLPVQTVTLRGLTSDERNRGRIGGSLLQQIVERIADEYEERGKYGTRIDISKRDLERLLSEQDGRLVIRISEASDAGSGANG